MQKKQPLRETEVISVFYKKQCNYFPQFEKKPVEKIRHKSVHMDREGRGSPAYGKFSRVYTRAVPLDVSYPKNIIYFPKVATFNNRSFHPSQKPVALLEYLINTYTKVGDVVLDFAGGSFSTAIACINTRRKFIGIEKDYACFAAGKQRVINYISGLEVKKNDI